MKSETKSTQSHIDTGDGVALTVTQARGGLPSGMMTMLVTSTLLAVVSLGTIGIIVSRTAPRPARSHAIAVADQSDVLRGRTWDEAHLGANGVEKCSAFRRVVEHTTALQSAGDGTISSRVRVGLDAELSAATAMPPAALTPRQCGVPL